DGRRRPRAGPGDRLLEPGRPAVLPHLGPGARGVAHDRLVAAALLLGEEPVADDRERAPPRADPLPPHQLRRAGRPVGVDRDPGDAAVAGRAAEPGPVAGADDDRG